MVPLGLPPSKGKGAPPQGLFRRQGRQDLQRKGASWEARLQMDPDSLLKVLVEIVKALPTKYGAFLQYVPCERFAWRSKEHPTSFERNRFGIVTMSSISWVPLILAHVVGCFRVFRLALAFASSAVENHKCEYIHVLMAVGL